jgi:hypothetical protein
MYIAGSPGDFDTSFGGSGVLSIADVLPPQRQSDAPREFVRALMSDDMGRTVVGGFSSQVTDQGWVLRLSRDGSLDKTFGKDGVVSDFGAPASRVLDVTSFNGDLCVGAEKDTNAGTLGFLRSLDGNGLALSSFNGGLDLLLGASPTALSSFFGNVVVLTAGVPHVYTTQGTVSETYSSKASGSIDSFTVRDSFGEVVYGRTVDNKGFEIGRLLNTGDIDTSFGNNGLATISCPVGKPQARSIRMIPGRAYQVIAAIVDCASGPTAGDEQSEVVALSSSGALLTTFGESGRLLVVPSGRSVGGVRDSNGNLAILGRHVLTTTAGSEVRVQISLVQNSGGGHATFSVAGVVNLPYVEDPKIAYEPEAERLVVVGNSSDAEGGGLKVMRIWL